MSKSQKSKRWWSTAGREVLIALVVAGGVSGLAVMTNQLASGQTGEWGVSAVQAKAKKSTPASTGQAEREEAVVARIVDGDTVELADGRKVRYIGIDTPETKHPTKPVGCYGQEAAARNQQLVLGKTVQLEKDVSETDRYGRLLRYVYVEGAMVNELLVKEGYARASTYPPDVKNQDIFREAEVYARSRSLGLWGPVCDQTSQATTTTQTKATTPTKSSTSTTTNSASSATPVPTPSQSASSGQACPNNCTEAKAMGMANMTADHPCWQAKFDRDKDGIGCEQ